MSRKRAVVSLGHDALGYTTGAQRDAVQVTARALADLVGFLCYRRNKEKLIGGTGV